MASVVRRELDRFLPPPSPRWLVYCGGPVPTWLRLAKDHDLIQALAAQCTNQAFRNAILPW
jgi:hypothetical protein